MAIRKPFATRSFAACLLLVAACSSKSDPAANTAPAGQSGVEAYCNAACEQATSCDPDLAGSSCASDCNDRSRQQRLVRADTMAAFEQCAGSLDCASIANRDDWVKALAKCQSDAFSATVPSDTVQAVCDKYTTAGDKCQVDLGSGCVDALKMYADSTLTALLACLDKACNQIAACQNMVLSR